MIIQKLKKLLSGICFGVIIILSSVGAYNVYKVFKPVQIEQVKEEVMRIKLESIGVLKVAESQQKYKTNIVKGKLFKTIKQISRVYECFYEYDLGDIDIIEDIDNKTITMIIDKNKLIMSPARLVEDDSYTTSKIISHTFDDVELKQIDKKALEVVTLNFASDTEFKDEALDSLEEKLTNLAKEMGFETIKVNTK